LPYPPEPTLHYRFHKYKGPYAHTIHLGNFSPLLPALAGSACFGRTCIVYPGQHGRRLAGIVPQSGEGVVVQRGGGKLAIVGRLFES
jgi:hypothetical protein